MSLAISRSKYTGDPGLFDIFKGAVRFAKGGIKAAFGGSVPDIQAPPGGFPFPSFAQNGLVKTPGVGGALERLFPGGATGMMPGCPPMSGYHANKSDYFLKSGEFVPAGTRMVRNRKRNPANARATSRAISRIVGAKRYAKSLSRVSIRKHSH